MLINTTRLYERVQAGLQHPDENVRLAAESVHSFFAFKSKESQIVLPPAVVETLKLIPELT